MGYVSKFVSCRDTVHVMYQLFIVLCYNRILALGIERMIREILDFIIDGRMVYINNKQWAQRKKEIEEE